MSWANPELLALAVILPILIVAALATRRLRRGLVLSTLKLARPLSSPRAKLVPAALWGLRLLAIAFIRTGLAASFLAATFRSAGPQSTSLKKGSSPSMPAMANVKVHQLGDSPPGRSLASSLIASRPSARTPTSATRSPQARWSSSTPRAW